MLNQNLKLTCQIIFKHKSPFVLLLFNNMAVQTARRHGESSNFSRYTKLLN